MVLSTTNTYGKEVIYMGWLGWSKESDGTETNEKHVEKPDGSKETHFLSTRDGSRSDHSHVVINERADGRKTAHAYPVKSKRS
jgi:hypothetical protein